MVGIRNAGSEAVSGLVMLVVMLFVVVGIAWPVLSELPWWQGTLAVGLSVVLGPLAGIVVLAVLVNVFMLPIHVREWRGKRRLGRLLGAITSPEVVSGVDVESDGQWATEVKPGSFWLVIKDAEEDLVRLAATEGPHRTLALRLLLRHGRDSEETCRVLSAGRALLVASDLPEEDERRLERWLEKMEREGAPDSPAGEGAHLGEG